jgi:hypothetical protein
MRVGDVAGALMPRWHPVKHRNVQPNNAVTKIVLNIIVQNVVVTTGKPTTMRII